MHFLGAVIAEKQDDIYGILAEWSEYADVDEYVKETRSEIIANGRADDQAYLEDHGNDTDPMHEKFKKAAAGRLALDDEAALKAYAEYRRLNLNEDGDAVFTFNEDSFYDYYEIGEWEGVDALQGITCRGLADRYNREDALARTDLAAYAVRRLEIRRIIIPSANLAGTTIPTGVEVIGLGHIDELLNQ